MCNFQTLRFSAIVWYAIHLNWIFSSVFFEGPQGHTSRTTFGPRTIVWETLGYGMGDWGIGTPFPRGGKDFSLLHSFQTDSGAHPASCRTGPGGSFPWGKTTGTWSWALPSRAEVKPYLRSPHNFMAWCLKKHRNNSILTVDEKVWQTLSRLSYYNINRPLRCLQLTFVNNITGLLAVWIFPQLKSQDNSNRNV
jgi:hypothetical protein